MNKLNIAIIIFFVAAVFEAYLAIPFIGGFAVISSLWTLLLAGLVLHIVAYTFAKQEGLSATPPMLGICASVFGWIPVVGWALHVVAFITYLWHILKGKKGLLTGMTAGGHSAATAEADTRTEGESVASSAAETAQTTSDAGRSDDLKKIEGIGPKIEEVLNGGGIKTFATLAMTEHSAIKQMLESNELGFHDPQTWPEQAALARDGKWDELKKWQDILDGGKETS